MPSRVDFDERAVVGWLLDDSKNAAYGLPKLGHHWFSDLRLRAVVSAASEVLASGKAVNVLTVFHQLLTDGEAETVGGAEFISQLPTYAVCRGAFDYMAGILREHAAARAYEQLGVKLTANPANGAKELAAFQASLPGQMDAEWSVGVAIDQIVDELDSRCMGNRGLLGVSCGYRELDKITDGIEPGAFWVVAARPSVGKTTLLLNMMLRISARCGLFSLEMGKKQIVKRLWFARSRVAMSKFWFDEMEFQRLKAGRIALQKMGLAIPGNANAKLGNLISEAHRMAASGVRVIFIDYLQLIEPDGARMDNRTAEITRVSNRLKRLARELQVPIVAACQLNRDAGKEGVAPQLHHLRDSGAIEQDADLVLMLQPNGEGFVEVAVKKNRNGPVPPPFRWEFDKSCAWIGEACDRTAAGGSVAK
jgi:replicative DNA helicase